MTKIDPELREACEDVVLNRRAGRTERLLALAERFKGGGQEAKEADLAWREWPVEKRLSNMRWSTASPISSRRYRGSAPCRRSARSM
jgi:cobalamin-dependent methionine synthase I